MKTDLVTAIIASIAGVLIAYFVTNMFIGPIGDITYTTVDSAVNASLADPDPEIFNYRALNPTVEVYVGECDEYNVFGECVEVETSVQSVTEEVVESVTEEGSEQTTDKPAGGATSNTEANQETD